MLASGYATLLLTRSVCYSFQLTFHIFDALPLLTGLADYFNRLASKATKALPTWILNFDIDFHPLSLFVRVIDIQVL